MTSPTVQQRYVSVEAAGHYCSISRTTIYRLIKEGQIESSTIGTRRVIDLRSIDAYVARQRSQGTPPASPESDPCPG